MEVKGGIKRRKKGAIQRKAKEECQPKEECQSMEEDQPTAEVKEAPVKVDKYVKRLKKEQLAQRDVIDKMQILIQDLVNVLKGSHIQQLAPHQQAIAEPEESNNEPMETETIPEAEEEEGKNPQTDDEDVERESTLEDEEKDEDDQEDKDGQADVQGTEE